MSKLNFETRDKLIYVLTGLFIVSFIIQFFLTQYDYSISLMIALFQLILSWIIAQLYFRFLNKQSYSQAGLWISWYLFTIIDAITIHFI